MGEGYNFAVLSKAIPKQSRATDWETARKEWSIIKVYEATKAEPVFVSITRSARFALFATGLRTTKQKSAMSTLSGFWVFVPI